MSSRLVQLDILRAIAVILVILYHYNCYIGHIPLWNDIIMKGGEIGVSIFFVLSGLLISLPFVKKSLYDGEMANVKQYFINRLLRIIPFFWILTIILYLCRDYIYLYTKAGITLTVQDLWSHLFFMSDRLNILNPVVWTLKIEIIVYIVFPILFWVTLQWHKKVITNAHTIYILSFMSFLVYRILIIALTNKLPIEDIISNIEGFVAGILIAFVITDDKNATNFRLPYPVLLPVITLILLLTLNQIFAQHSNYYYPFFKSITNACIFFIFVGLLRRTIEIKKRLLLKPIVFISTISYSLYLVHFNVYYNVCMPLIKSLTHREIINNWVTAGCSLIVTIAISILTYGIIEQPILSLKNGVRRLNFDTSFAFLRTFGQRQK